jgi:hypothetical protein
MADLETLATLPSRRTPGKSYTVKRNPETSEISCDCPGWIYSKRDPRSCRHTLVFEKLYSDVAINPGTMIETAPKGRVLSKEEVDARNKAEFRSTRPTPEQVVEGNRAKAAGKKPRKVTSETTARMTIRTITFDDE